MIRTDFTRSDESFDRVGELNFPTSPTKKSLRDWSGRPGWMVERVRSPARARTPYSACIIQRRDYCAPKFPPRYKSPAWIRARSKRCSIFVRALFPWFSKHSTTSRAPLLHSSPELHSGRRRMRPCRTRRLLDNVRSRLPLALMRAPLP